MPHTKSRPLLVLAFAFATGCSFSIDANLAKPDPARDSATDHEDAGHLPPEEDADIALPDDAGEDDGGFDAQVEQDASEDAGCTPPPEDAGPDADARVEIDSSIPCEHDDECAADQYCASGWICLPRCSEADGCALLEAELSNLISDGAETAYYGTAAWRDAFNNPIEPHRLWSLRPEGTPRVVRGDLPKLPRPTLVAGGYIYAKFEDSEGSELVRFPADGSGSIESLAVAEYLGIVAVWHAAGQVYWARRSGELWRIAADEQAQPVRLAAVPGTLWLGGNSTIVVSAQADAPSLAPLVARALTDLTATWQLATDSLRWGDGVRVVVDEKAVYYHWGYVKRVFLDSPAPATANLSPVSTLPGTFELAGDGWAYWFVNAQDTQRTFGRAHRDVPSAGAVLWKPSYAVSSLAVVRNWVVLSDGRHLFVHPNPPLPCAEDLPCPASLTCSEAQRCE